MRHVEFLGVPGSGKSTLARALTTISEKTGQLWSLDEATRRALRWLARDRVTRTLARRLGTNAGRLWKAAYARTPDRVDAVVDFVTSWPEYVETVLSVQRDRAGRDVDQDVVLKWVFDLGAQFRLATRVLETCDILLIDEGFAQRSVAVFGHGWSAHELTGLHRYLTTMPRPDRVLFVDTPLSVCQQRLDLLGWPARVASKRADERFAYLRSANEIVNAVVDVLGSAGVSIERLDGGASIDDACIQARRALSI